jgi:hypothetical protein
MVDFFRIESTFTNEENVTYTQSEYAENLQELVKKSEAQILKFAQKILDKEINKYRVTLENEIDEHMKTQKGFYKINYKVFRK